MTDDTQPFGPESNHTILVAFVIPGVDREHACFRMRDVLDRMYQHAGDKEDNEIQLCIDEAWFPNDACVNPHSSERVIWQRDVTAQDLIRAEMQKIAPTDPTEHDRTYAIVRQGEPALTLWEDDVEDSAHAAAEAVLSTGSGLRENKNCPECKGTGNVYTGNDLRHVCEPCMGTGIV